MTPGAPAFIMKAGAPASYASWWAGRQPVYGFAARIFTEAVLPFGSS